MGVQTCPESLLSVLLDIYLEEELLDHVVILHVVFFFQTLFNLKFPKFYQNASRYQYLNIRPAEPSGGPPLIFSSLYSLAFQALFCQGAPLLLHRLCFLNSARQVRSSSFLWFISLCPFILHSGRFIRLNLQLIYLICSCLQSASLAEIFKKL